ncbi:MAG: hypothetical protein WCW01_06260 [Gammaproteobacteria bacterium]
MNCGKILLVLFLVFGLTACGISNVTSKNKRSLSSEDVRNLQPLQVPSDLTGFKSESYYPLPKMPAGASGANTVGNKILVPPGSDLGKVRRKN